MKKFVMLLVVMSMLAPSAFAKKDLWEAAQSPVYKEKAPAMLGRGLINALSCPIDMFAQAVKGAKETQPQVMGAVGGFAQGAACTVFRAASGIIDVATFWVPGFNGLPVCRSYDDCLNCSDEASTDAYTAPAPTYEPAPSRYVAPEPQTYVAPAPAPVKEDRMKYIKK